MPVDDGRLWGIFRARGRHLQNEIGETCIRRKPPRTENRVATPTVLTTVGCGAFRPMEPRHPKSNPGMRFSVEELSMELDMALRFPDPYSGTSFVRSSVPLGPYSGTMRRALW